MGIHMQKIGFSAAILTHLKEAILSDVAHLILGVTKDVKWTATKKLVCIFRVYGFFQVSYGDLHTRVYEEFSASILTHLKEAIRYDVGHLILGVTKDVKCTTTKNLGYFFRVTGFF